MISEAQRQAWDRYRIDHPKFVAIAAEMNARLRDVVQAAGVDADVSARAKDVASFAKKIMVKAYADPWAQVTDKIGARIVVGLRTEQQRILDAIEADPTLELVGDIDDKASALNADQFRYTSIHFQLAVPGRENGQHPELECEVQLRTRAQHMWAVSEHRMVYKGVIATPEQTRRRVNRLTALVELFDEQLEVAMAEVSALPNYGVARVLQAAQAQYRAFSLTQGNDLFSIGILQDLGTLLDIEHVDDYVRHLGEFVSSHSSKIEQILTAYGLDSESDERYLLLSQPEVLVVFDLIDKQAYRLASSVADSYIVQFVRPLYTMWDATWPLD